MEVFVRHLKLLWTSERMLGELKLRVFTHKIILGALAALAGLFGLGMLNLAAFFALEVSQGKALAALYVALANLVLAVVLVLIAQRLAPGPEAKVVEEVREMALADLEAEARVVQNELRLVRDEIMGFRSTISTLVKNPLEALAPKILFPLIAALTQLIRNWDGPSKPSAKRSSRQRKTDS